MVLSPGCASESAGDSRTLLPEGLPTPSRPFHGTCTRMLQAELPGLEDLVVFMSREWKVRYEGHCAEMRSQELDIHLSVKTGPENL